MDIPKIGGTRGIFEIFIPGVFLFINLGIVIFISSYSILEGGIETKEELKVIFNPLVLLVILISFGYLFGVVLRLLSPNKLDKLSGKLFFRDEEFPYIKHIGEKCKNKYPDDVLKYYNKYWKGREKEYGGTGFFNYCKLMIYSIDENLGREIYLAESLTRYLSGIYNALKISSMLYLIPIGVWGFILLQGYKFNLSLVIVIALIFILFIYIYLLWKILKNFRKIRVKEATTIFIATYKHQDKLKLKKTLLSNDTEKNISN